MGRIAQQSVTSTAYFLGDALGSVRQLTDGGGRLALARWYDPYGNLASNRGDAATVYGFTGEWETTLLDLRARWYAPAYGRFNSKDVWPSDDQQPLSLNGWLYAESNPVNYTDPSGHIVCRDIIPSWRPFFVALKLCDPQAEPALTQPKRGAFETFDQTLNPPFVTCGVGYTPYGFVCIPTAVGRLLEKCGAKSPDVLQQGAKNSAEDQVPGEEDEFCQTQRSIYEDEVSHALALARNIMELTFERERAKNPLDRDVIDEAIEKLTADLSNLLNKIAKRRQLAEIVGCDTDTWPAPPGAGGDAPVPVPVP